MKQITKIIIICVGILFQQNIAQAKIENIEGGTKPAGGIRTEFGDVLIENLGIGRTYNLRELAGTPLKVTNTGLETMDLRIDVTIPGKDFMTQGRLEKGYTPIPSVDWINLSQSQFLVPPGESAYTDVIIKIPDDPSLFGKKFQASIFSRGTNKAFLNLGVWSHLMMTIVQSPEAQKIQEGNRKRGIVENMDYTLIPDKLVISGAKPGEHIDIKKLGRSIRIANSGDKTIRLRLKALNVGSSPLNLQAGYEDANPEWLKIKKEIVDAEPSSFVDTGITINLPNDPGLAKKKLMFVLKVELADPNIVGVTYYGKIYVEME